MSKFPKILAAARQIELDQWQLGDALIEECGEPLKVAARFSGNNDGSWAKLQEASEFLTAYGLDYSVSYLAKLRNTAFDFQGRNRKANLSWSAHNEAGSPETLKTVIDELQGDKPTRDAIREKVRKLEDRPAPRGTGIASQPERETRISWLSGLLANLHEANGLMDASKEAMEIRTAELDQTNVDHIVEVSLEISAKARDVSNLARKFTLNKRGHLSAVGE